MKGPGRAGRSWMLGMFALLLVLPAPSWAGRPLDTEDTDTVEPGKVELELNADYARDGRDQAGAFGAKLNLGLIPDLELDLQGVLALAKPEGEGVRAGAGDALVGFKYRLLRSVLKEEDGWPAALARLTVRLPTGSSSRELGTDGYDIGLLLSVSRAVSETLTLTGNAGYTFVTEGGDLDFVTLAAALEYRVAEPLALVGEVVASLATGRDADHTAIARVGVSYELVKDRVTLDAAIGTGLTSASPDLVVTLGVTISF